MNNTRLRSGKGGPKRRTPLKAKTALKRSGAPLAKTEIRKQNRRRAAKELLRCYGPPARRAWMKSLPCLICGSRPVDQAHIETGGTGRKADYDKLVPLCSGPAGHHAELHRGAVSFECKYRIDLAAEAARVEAAWLLRAGASCKTGRNQTLTEGR